MATLTLKNISEKSFLDEVECVKSLYEASRPFQDKQREIFARAKKYVEGIREHSDELSVESFLKEYSLSTYEGVAIMCLAEALLRIPDNKTADELISDKLGQGNWKKHFSENANIMLNASTFGLMISGQILHFQRSKQEITHAIGSITSKISDPIIREALKKAMKILGRKFVIGTSSEDALKNAKKIGEKGYLFSFDMLGEGARTAAQAEGFYKAYIDGIKEIGAAYKRNPADYIYHRPNVSVKLSALHPRYEMLNKSRLLEELLPKLKKIALTARDNGIWIAIDAEEANRLEISLVLFEALLKDKEFSGFNGLGFVVQAYQKRAPYVIDYLKQLADETKRIIPIRLVKGAYWDSEVKHAQMHGLPNYPVFTQKAHTDLSYLICARKLLENLKYFYPQFATHNALTVASILEISADYDATKDFEFQRLYGMGDAFYDEMVKSRPVRIYAPVGTYQDLLPYLIRRILENGANTSFVNLVVNKAEPIGQILTNPIDKIIRNSYANAEGSLPLPADIFGEVRKNSIGKDYGYSVFVNELAEYHKNFKANKINPKSIIAGKEVKFTEIELALKAAEKAYPAWNSISAELRAQYLNQFAEALEQNEDSILPLLMQEAYKTPNDAVAELREAIDFLRYYAADGVKKFGSPKLYKGYTGEKNLMHYKGKGVFLCISPWNFPLAIFLGQISGALMAGNTVIAKPAPQTEKIAYIATKLAHAAGIPKEVFQLVLNGDMETGAKTAEALVSDARVAGVAFTGSTKVAHKINNTLGKRGVNVPIATLIAETGGQNAMIIDSSALLERAVDDAINSAFGAAGQRCSALRVLYIQDDVYKQTLELLKGALAELNVGYPAADFSVDVPPVIDENAQSKLRAHIVKMRKAAKLIAKATIDESVQGTFIAPHIFEIPDISVLKEEVFGPVLHVIKYKKSKIDAVIDQINSTGYGLTFGIHSRVESFIEHVISRVKVGNIYINRSQIGAVVGVHPFGGVGLSGTGFKAGGANYLKRFVNEVTVTNNIAAIGGNLELIS
jgi:RHH-type proline utilization regulon transcriptional repressor/proline dehydrogenase/delta 1-pyrroline-5-carboxylate dehydrogenase